MKKLIHTGIFLFFILLSAGSFAQQPDKEFKEVDEYVKSLGGLDSLNAGTISYAVTSKFPNVRDKLRAIYVWIATNIGFDCKKYRSQGNEKMLSDEVLKTKMANPNGYASLFQDMCSAVKIRCLTVDGYIKNNIEDIGQKPDELNHTWAVVQLGQSPEEWHYVDVAMGSGYTDDKMTVFTKQFNGAYFFPNKMIFNSQHFPDNTAWLLGPGTKSLNSFLDLPLVKDAAHEFLTTIFTPSTGLVKAKANEALLFTLKVSPVNNVEIVALRIGEKKKQQVKTMDHIWQSGTVSFRWKFNEEDIYPVTVMVNNKPVLSYVIEVKE